jgi:hypothetical protein
MKTLLVALIGIGWIGCGPFLAWFMSKRGHGALSWLAVGLVAGPSALAIALLERRGWAPPLPEVVVRGKDGRGAVNILVVVDDADVVPVARPLVEWFGCCVGRLTVARVLPEGDRWTNMPTRRERSRKSSDGWNRSTPTASCCSDYKKRR